MNDNNTNVVSSFEFWQAMVKRAIRNFDYGISSEAELSADLVRLGMDEDKANWFVYEDDE